MHGIYIPLRIHCKTLGCWFFRMYLGGTRSVSKWPSKKSYVIAFSPKHLSLNNQGLQEAVFKQNRPKSTSKESRTMFLLPNAQPPGSSAQEITQEKEPDSFGPTWSSIRIYVSKSSKESEPVHLYLFWRNCSTIKWTKNLHKDYLIFLEEIGTGVYLCPSGY